MKVLLGLSLLMGCGGALSSPLLDGGTDGGGDASGDAADAGVTCDQLFAQLATQETAATTCCAMCDIVQCTAQVDGLCCPLTVNEPNGDSVKAYEATLMELQSAHCAFNCPALACSTKPSGMCDQTGACKQ
jgi:hypothetical protein